MLHRPGKSAREIAPLLAAAFVILSPASGRAECYTTEQQLPAATVNSFLNDPGQLLRQNSSGGGAMITQVRDLVASNKGTLDLIINLLKTANKEQKAAIGSGLAQAARLCVRPDREQADRIQAAVANTKDEPTIVAYIAITGDKELGGIGGGQGGAGGAGSGGFVGGQINPLHNQPSSTGAPQQIGGHSVPTGPFNISSSVTGNGSGNGTNGSATNPTQTSNPTISNPVSP